MEIVEIILLGVALFGFVAAMVLPPYLMSRIRRLK
jgi:hypothetical protein